MAKAARIDSVTFNPDGTVTVIKSEGEAPLPAGTMGMGINYADKASFIADCEALELELLTSGKLALIQLAKALKADPNMGQGFITAAQGKTITLDLVGAANPIVVG